MNGTKGFTEVISVKVSVGERSILGWKNRW